MSKEEKISLSQLKKAEDILDNGRLIQLYSLFPTQEEKKEFMGSYLDAYGDRLYEKLNARLQDEFEETDIQTLQGRFKENKRNQKSITDILRSRRRDPLRKGATERINSLVSELRQGGYISTEDREFLAKHLAKRGIFDVLSPSQAREDVRQVLDKYVEARNTELDNDAESKKNRQELEATLLSKKATLANTYKYSQNWEASEGENGLESKREKLKREIEEIEDILQSESQKRPVESMINPAQSNLDISQNNAQLQQLIQLLEQENGEYEQKGIKLPETGIRESDSYEIGIDEIEQVTNDLRLPQIQKEIQDTRQIFVESEKLQETTGQEVI